MTTDGGEGDPAADALDARGARADGRGTLYVVATPIGNLSDISLRALETLKAVSLVAAEDTRLTRRLFARHGVSNRLVSYHARSGDEKRAELVAALRAGRDIALVTDAGTPLVSDPGADLVSAWAAEGGNVVPIPGASAVLAAIVASAVAGPQWTFEAFLPRSGRERRERLARLAADPRAAVIYEAPGRVAATLRDLAGACGDERRAAVCRELTKIHETTVRGSLGELASRAAAGEIPARGEFVIVVGAGEARPRVEAPAVADALAAARADVERLVADGIARGDAARRVAATTGLPRRALYGGEQRRGD